MNKKLFFAVGALLAGQAALAGHEFDSGSNILTLDSVRIAGSTTEYTGVRLDIGSARVVGTAPSRKAGVASLPAYFNGATRRLSIPRVQAGSAYADNVLVELGSDYKVLKVEGSRAAALVPRVPSLSSHQNKVASGESVGPLALPTEVISGNAVAYADFFGDGGYSLVTHTLDYIAADWSLTRFGQIKFYKAVGGAWQEQTASILADSRGCLHPRKAIVSDFNGDGRPDVFFACHGYDRDPFPGESPRILLSQPDGDYVNRELSTLKGFFHAASAADINGDGHADILLVNNFDPSAAFFLIGAGDGSFTRDNTRFPASVQGKGYFTAELIDVDNSGRHAAFLAGHEQQQQYNAPATLFRNDGSGNFREDGKVQIPAANGYGFVTDAVFANGAFYVARTIDLESNFYGGAAIQKIAYPSLQGSVLYQNNAGFPTKGDKWSTKWINWIIPYRGQIATMDSFYGVSVAQ